MHDVVLLYRCYPSTPHGVGPWLPAPSSAPQPELPHWFASLGAPAPDDGPFVAWLECNGHFVTWVSSDAEPHFWTFDRPATVTVHYLPDPTVVLARRAAEAQRDELARFCDVCGFTWPPDERCPFH